MKTLKTDKSGIFNYTQVKNEKIVEENIKLMIDILHHASIDPEQRKIMEIEQE